MISAIDPSQVGGAETILWTPRKLAKFKRVAKQATIKSIHPDGSKSFEFEGRVFLITFAVLLIKHFENEFNKPKH